MHANPQPPLYLDMLDDLLASGLRQVDAGEIAPLIAAVMACQRGDGGFAAGSKASNPADTDRAVAALSMLSERQVRDARIRPLLGVGEDCQGCRHRCMWTRPVADYVNWLPLPEDLQGCFHRLNLQRMLARAGVVAQVDAAAMAITVYHWRKETPANVLDTILASHCFQMLALQMPLPREAIAMIIARHNDDGGFDGSISATAAAVAFLAIHENLDAAIVPGIVRFLTRQLATSANPPDIFHGLLTLWTLGAMDAIDRLAIRKRLDASASPAQADVASAYYCLAATALLKLAA